MELSTILSLDAKAAVFARGFMEAFTPGGPLRDCQAAGLKAIEDLGGEISVAYVSKLSRVLTDSGVVSKIKRGRNWFVTESVHTAEFLTYLEDDLSYGSSIVKQVPMDDIVARSTVLDYLKSTRTVQVDHERRLPKAAFMALMDRFKEGKLNMVFVEPGSRLTWLNPDDGQEYVVPGPFDFKKLSSKNRL